MDSFASTSSHPYTRYRQAQPVGERIVRAIRHHLRLLHRSESNFFVLGATGNVYTVILSMTPSCTCPDRTTPCKHILFVLIRVLGVSLDDTCLRRSTLRLCQVSSLLGMPTLPDALAGETLRRIFHELFFKSRPQRAAIEIQEGRSCPVCLDEMDKGERVVACGTCRNVIHEECWLKWKRSGGRRPASCVICRARWRNIKADEDKYLNLAAYIREDDGG
ncbi:hypothetical protein HS088_TW09G01302 [Tripterygium wilfordii]|uniref:Mitogen-activated protein kinase kinase kinase 1 n=1 Tax=Tripterygium wilfordii TaxID=458696 RepID=A0A7J7DA55_TRIWF|nr:uncharacterized protein LOC120006681 [Tripterygium wilfordii]KAF5743237.1 hypothetical protein HS088_TW09G01302 [Tripterygium wilfordii]